MGRPSATSSRPILLPLLLAVLVLHESSSLADGAGVDAAAAPLPTSLVEKTCKVAARREYDSCVSTLNSVPESKNATDAGDLVLIAAKMTHGNVSDTVSAIKELLRNLRHCLKAYNEISHNLRDSAKWIKVGNSTLAAGALGVIESKAAVDCDGMMQKGTYMKNPLSQENINTQNMAVLVRGLYDMVLGWPSEKAPVMHFPPTATGKEENPKP